MEATTDQRAWTRHTFAAMGTAVTVQLPAGVDVSTLSGQVESLFTRVERSCTRFRQDSDLMRANEDPAAVHQVAPECASIVAAAFDAYAMTGGLFDPRILRDLVSAGYDRSFHDVPAESRASAGRDSSSHAVSTWRPRVDTGRTTIELGPDPIDLGGIGKGWCVDAAAAILATEVPSFLVNAGGDLAVSGDGPDGDGWTAAVEDPSDPTRTLAVLQMWAGSCATSSTGRRRWVRDGEPRHHLIDPRTGRPAAGGLQSVTVIADSTVTAEVWSKSLLITGENAIADVCRTTDIAAYWVTTDGRTAHSPALTRHLMWERDNHDA
ncbi:MAG: FAD:protein FMN transferase [Actinomycetes bacterium]